MKTVFPIADALTQGVISVNKAAQYARLVLQEDYNEDKINLRNSRTTPIVSKPMKERFYVKKKNKYHPVICPKCNNTVFANKEVKLFNYEKARKLNMDG